MHNSSESGEPARVDKKALFISRSIGTILYVLIEGMILFVAAGRMDWLFAWLYLIGYMAYLFISQRVSHEKLKQTSNKRMIWEQVLVFGYRMTHPIILVLAGLELNRSQQSFTLGITIQIIAFLFLILTFALMLWAEAENPYYYFRIPAGNQWEQKITTTGPYQFIRHPGYLGFFMLALARPLVLGSLLGFIPGIIGALIMILRTYLEDRALQNGVDGYKLYTQTVRYRLFENIW